MIKLFSNGSRALPKAFALLASAAALVYSAGHANAQSYVTYGTTFDNLVGGYTLSGQDNWDTTDLNQSDYVGVISNYSAGGTDFWGGIGGFQQPSVTPGTSAPSLFRPYSLGTASIYAFNVDFGISSSSTTYPTQDSFGWSFQSASGTKVFSLNFDPSSTAGVDAIRLQVGPGGEVSTGDGISLNAKYHLTVSVNITAGTVSATVRPLGGGTTVTVVSNAPVSSIALGSVTQTAAVWTLSNTSSPGDNGMFFNNYVVTIPEPSTYAMILAGAGLVFVVSRRRSRA